jgi:hypothetical protein
MPRGDALRRLFESVVQRCSAEGLINADGFAINAKGPRAFAFGFTRILRL